MDLSFKFFMLGFELHLDGGRTGMPARAGRRGRQRGY